MAASPDDYRSLDYADNVRLLRAKGYLYLTCYTNREVPCTDLESEPGYEAVMFCEAVPSVKPVADDGRHVTCVPIDSEEAIILLDSDTISFQVAESYF